MRNEMLRRKAGADEKPGEKGRDPDAPGMRRRLGHLRAEFHLPAETMTLQARHLQESGKSRWNPEEVKLDWRS